MKNLKARLKRGEALAGCWLNLGSSVTAEIVGLSGFDWVLIDLEHGAGESSDLRFQLQALTHTSAAAIVRVESFERQRLHRVLDLGAEGIMCPRVNNVEEARAVAEGLFYPPIGTRGVAKMVRATNFGAQFSEYRENAKDNLLSVVQIETTGALDCLEGIAALDGVDVLFIGPADLSMALGIFGQFDHPLFKDAIRATVNAAKKAGKATGILLFNPDDFPTYHEMGIQLIACGSDATFVADGARRTAERLNSFISKSLNQT